MCRGVDRLSSDPLQLLTAVATAHKTHIDLCRRFPYHQFIGASWVHTCWEVSRKFIWSERGEQVLPVGPVLFTPCTLQHRPQSKLLSSRLSSDRPHQISVFCFFFTLIYVCVKVSYRAGTWHLEKICRSILKALACWTSVDDDSIT